MLPFFLVTFAFPSACHKDCWFTKKTRGSLKDCYGKVLPLTADLARGLGVEQGEAYACFKHRRALAKEDDRCSSVLLKNHSKKLLAIPQKLYQFLDDRGKTVDNYRPGGKWEVLGDLSRMECSTLLQIILMVLFFYCAIKL